MRDLVKLVKRGEPMIWLTGSALGISILMIVGLVIVILMNGLSFFWPKPLEQVTLEDGSVFLGELSSREPIPNPGHADHNQKHRLLLRVGNRDLYGFDFKWVNEDEIGKRERPGDAFFVERREYGALIGTPVAVKRGEQVVAADPADKSRFTLFHPTPEALMRELNTDRPDQTEGPITVDAGHLQLELDLVTYAYDRETSGGVSTRVGTRPQSDGDVAMRFKHPHDGGIRSTVPLRNRERRRTRRPRARAR